MCGIAGILAKGTLTSAVVDRLLGPIEHRGPDDCGAWVDPEAGIGLGHRRLSIVDLSPAGHEPMHSASGRYVITYNGEIYNHQALRRSLEERGLVPDGGWRGHSDIETFLQAIECDGLNVALEQAVGMFAFALWDRKERKLQLVRDRFGEKPLYYGWVGGDFLFASELKAMRAHPGFDNEVDREALGELVARSYIGAPRSIYRGIYKLPPACILTTSAEAIRDPHSTAIEPYWSYRDVVERGLADPISDEAEAFKQLECALADAVKGQSAADVPVGAFLSGGIDSSLITAFYQRHSNRPIQTYSIGFADQAYNEADHAKAVAAHLGTVHHEQYVTERDAIDVIPLLPQIYDEPFADSSQIPTYLVSRFARREVKVALTGDGGDELFGGYNRHNLAPLLWRRLERLPRPLRAALGHSLSALPLSFWSSAMRLVPGRPQPLLGPKFRKALGVAATAASFDDVVNGMLDDWPAGGSPVIGASGRPPPIPLDLGGGASDSERLMYGDSVSYLPSDILCKVDRASMAVSLETRVPFLDHRLSALAARIPISSKIGGGVGKLILRKMLDAQVPRALTERPKAGFALPLGEWLRGDLRPWAEELLAPERLESGGFFETRKIRDRWHGHLAGRADSTQALWSILMFQAWREGVK